MARPRKERSEREWLEFGEYLIDCLGKNQYKSIKRRVELKKKTQELFNKLETAKCEHNQKDLDRLIKELNAFRNDYGDAWITFVKKISQRPIDQNRVRTDLSLKSAKYFQNLMILNGECGIPKTYEHLYVALESLGIEKINQLVDIRTFLSKYQDHSKRHTKTSLHSESTDNFDFGLALKSIIELLNKHGLNNFHELKNALRKRTKEDNKLKKYEYLEKYFDRQNISIDEFIKKDRGY